MTIPYTREEILAEKARRDALKREGVGAQGESYQPKPQPGVGFSREEILTEKARRDALKAKSQEQEFSWPTFIVQQAAKGALALPDLLEAAASTIKGSTKAALKAGMQDGKINPFIGMGSQSAAYAGGQEKVKKDRQLIEESVKEDEKNRFIPSSVVPDTQVPKTGLQRIAGHVARGAGSAALPLGGLAGILPATGIGATQGLAQGALEEAGVSPGIAALATLGGTAGVGLASKAMSAKKLAPSTSSIGAEIVSESPKEFRKVSDYLKSTLSEEDVNSVIHNLKNKPQYPITGYEPMSAEVSGAPSVAQIHRARYETAGSELPVLAGQQRDALADAFEANSLNAASGESIKAGIADELARRKAVRRAETEPLYEQLKNETQPIVPKSTRKFIKEANVAGPLESSLGFVKKEVVPKVKKRDDYANYYSKLSPEARKGLTPPEGMYPEARRLHAVTKAVNDQIRKAKRAGEDNKTTIFRQAKEALEEDLNQIPLHKEASDKYRRLSEPVSKIAEHPELKKILKSRANDPVSGIYDKNALDNVKALKDAIGSDNKLWSGFQQKTIQHLEKSISNAGAEGSRNAISYPKLKKFLDNNQDALKEVLTADQLSFLGELKSAIHGQNIAKTLGRGEGSPTANRLATQRSIDEGLGIITNQNKPIGLKFVEKASEYIPGKVVKESLKYRLNRYMQTRNADMYRVLDETLKNPDVLQEVLTRDFSNQKSFNDFMNSIASGIKNATPRDYQRYANPALNVRKKENQSKK